MALVLERGKKFILPGAVYVFLMCLSRNYLMAHYPSDVLAGAVVGSLSAVAAWLIARQIFALLRRYKGKPFCRFVLYVALKRLNRVASRALEPYRLVAEIAHSKLTHFGKVCREGHYILGRERVLRV